VSRRIFRSCLKTIEQAVIKGHNQSTCTLVEPTEGVRFQESRSRTLLQTTLNFHSPLRATTKETEFKTLIHGYSWTETGGSNSTKYEHILQKSRSQKCGMKQITYWWSTNISRHLKKFSHHGDVATGICAPQLHPSLNSKLRVESQLLTKSLNHLQINTIPNFKNVRQNIC
jgi:hypothetical protein